MQNTETLSKNNFMKAPCLELKGLNNLFFELNGINVLKKERLPYARKKLNEGLKLEKIKNALIECNKEELKEIYLIGGEPLYHPDFNTILRLSLKFANTTVITNATSINEKKARFLRKIDDESNFETIYRINLSYWEERKNDSIRGYGNFRRTISAINSLIKYGFNPIINFINITKETYEETMLGFSNLFKKYNLDFEDINLKFNEFIDISEIDMEKLSTGKINEYDCATSRAISQRGVFACPSLCNDFRARVGSDLKDFTKKTYLDTEKCLICRISNRKIYVNDWI